MISVDIPDDAVGDDRPRRPGERNLRGRIARRLARGADQLPDEIERRAEGGLRVEGEIQHLERLRDVGGLERANSKILVVGRVGPKYAAEP